MRRGEIRENIFKLLFRLDFNEGEAMIEQLDLFKDDLGVIMDYPEVRDDVSKMSFDEKNDVVDKCKKIMENISDIDTQINEVSKNWKTTRMNKVDVTIIRLAVYEIQHDESVPTKVAINEAVELAKRYGTDKSATFVNGVLAKFA
ncbi:NusB antitermination factor [Lachnospiraceae bacterium C7]|nr:NusB antitermination factor [Lachnospiraceae bacterium C7]